jgi:hypothetical protein
MGFDKTIDKYIEWLKWMEGPFPWDNIKMFLAAKHSWVK